jgi:hypothetical protein
MKTDPLVIKFMKKHRARLTEQGLLSEATEDAFLLLAKTHAHLMHLDPDAVTNGWIRYIALLKTYQSYARGFGMNTDKPKQPIERTEFNDFGI